MGKLVRISVLADSAENAVRLSLRDMLNTALDSDWSQGAIGWQMFWRTPGAVPGVYATCDTMLLISQCSKLLGLTTKAMTALWVRAFEKHLCPQMDFSAMPTDEEQRQAILLNEHTTYKQARFLLCAAHAQNLSAASIGIVDSVLQGMKLRKLPSGTWPDTRTSAEPSIMATAEAFRALSQFEGVPFSEIELAAKYLHDATLQDQVGFERVIALEALTFAKSRGNSDIREQLESPTLAPEILWQYMDLNEVNDSVATRKFLSLSPTRSDFFSHNQRLLSGLCLVRLVANGSLPTSAILPVVPLIQEVNDALATTFVFVSNSKTSPHHWETSEAIQLLLEFGSLVSSNPQLKEMTAMLIKPRVFADKNFTVNPELVFVIMPLEEPFKKNVLPAIKKAAADSRLKLKVKTSEMKWTDGQIINTIWEQINSAAYVVADCTGRNPNVFYELGIAHTLGKPTYLCASSRDDFPFDISGIRSYDYRDISLDAMTELTRNLRSFFQEAAKEVIV